MKRTLIQQIPEELPQEIKALANGALIFDSSCSSNAKVYFIDKDGGYYLKTASAEVLSAEATMARYFHKKGLGAEVLDYQTLCGRDILLFAKVAGEDCTHQDYISQPCRLCDLVALKLRELHELDAADCPVQDRMTSYIALSEKNYFDGTYDMSHFPDSFGYESGEAAYRALCDGRSAFKNDVLLHGDYCLPNIMLDGWRFSGFIDVGSGGIGDRHIDLFWGAWSLSFNLGTDKFRDRFLDAYGRDKIDDDILKTVAAAEVFG